MTKIKFNVKGVQRGDAQQPDPGLYRGKITKIEQGSSKAGNNMLTVSLKITNKTGPQKAFKGTALRTWVVIDSEATAWKFAEFLDAVGATKKGDAGSLDLDKVVGTEIQFKVDGGEYNGNYQARVGTLTALPEDAEDDDEAESEDEAEEETETEGDEPEEEEEAEEEEPEEEVEEEEEAEPEDDEEEEIDLSTLKLAELKDLAKEHGVKTTFPKKADTTAKKKAVLVERLEAALGNDDDPFE